jgi:hypothetical protein
VRLADFLAVLVLTSLQSVPVDAPTNGSRARRSGMKPGGGGGRAGRIPPFFVSEPWRDLSVGSPIHRSTYY